MKFAPYQTIESLQEYLLVSQWEQRVEVFRRRDRKFWLLQTYTTEEIIELESINIKIPITGIYEGVDLSNWHWMINVKRVIKNTLCSSDHQNTNIQIYMSQ